MWVKREEYIQLREQRQAQSTTIEWLRQRINQLERRNALLEAKVTGIPPVDVMQIDVAEPQIPVKTAPRPTDERPTMQDILQGNMSFEDMGDVAAHKQGVGWDPHTGTVNYQ